MENVFLTQMFRVSTASWQPELFVAVCITDFFVGSLRTSGVHIDRLAQKCVDCPVVLVDFNSRAVRSSPSPRGANGSYAIQVVYRRSRDGRISVYWR